jgi:hypothetical protein
MLKARIYIIQVLGILLLLCGYLLSDQPDSLSVMHFDSNPSKPSVITKAMDESGKAAITRTSVSSETNNHKHKSKVPRHVSFELIMPAKSGYTFSPVIPMKYIASLPENYCYIFYREINPPPPKSC